jgi:hypothetical protein
MGWRERGNNADKSLNFVAGLLGVQARAPTASSSMVL